MFNEKLPDHFQKAITLFYIFTSSLRVPVSPRPCQLLLLLVLVIVAVLVGVESCLILVRIWISILTNVEHLFLCFLRHLYLLGEMSVHFLYPFLN